MNKNTIDFIRSIAGEKYGKLSIEVRKKIINELQDEYRNKIKKSGIYNLKIEKYFLVISAYVNVMGEILIFQINSEDRMMLDINCKNLIPQYIKENNIDISMLNEKVHIKKQTFLNLLDDDDASYKKYYDFYKIADFFNIDIEDLCEII